jgi:hypothetical protein
MTSALNGMRSVRSVCSTGESVGMQGKEEEMRKLRIVVFRNIRIQI